MMMLLCSSVVHDDRPLTSRPDPMLASDMTLSIRAIVVDTLSGGGQLDPSDGIGSTRILDVVGIFEPDFAVARGLFSC